MLSVSRDYFDEHVKPELRIVYRCGCVATRGEVRRGRVPAQIC
jgi:hypothetical protein